MIPINATRIAPRNNAEARDWLWRYLDKIGINSTPAFSFEGLGEKRSFLEDPFDGNTCCSAAHDKMCRTRDDDNSPTVLLPRGVFWPFTIWRSFARRVHRGFLPWRWGQ